MVEMMISSYQDGRLLDKCLRVMSSCRTEQQRLVAMKYLRLARKRVRLQSSKDLLSSWINDMIIKGWWLDIKLRPINLWSLK